MLAGGLLLGAPLVYQTFAKKDGADNGFILLTTALISFTAAFTELLTLFFALADSAAEVSSTTVVLGLLILCGILALDTFLYGWQALAFAFVKPTAMGDVEAFASARSPASARTSAARPGETDNWSLF